MKTRILTVLIFAILFSIPASAGVKIIVNDKNPAPDSMTKDEVANLFLKKSTRWSNGQTVVPLEMKDGSLRSDFSETILDKDITAVKSYWQKMIFSGRATAPVELGSEDEVLTFVRKFPAAIGYVSDGAKIPEGVKVIKVD